MLVQLGLYLQFYMPIAHLYIRFASPSLPCRIISIPPPEITSNSLVVLTRLSGDGADLLLGLLHEVPTKLSAWALRRQRNVLCHGGILLDEALLLLALGVDGRGGLLGLVAAAHGEPSTSKGGGEGRNCEL